MKKLELIFSTTDSNGDRTSQRHVMLLIAGMADLHCIDGYTLNEAVTGYWQGSQEDSYTLTVLTFTDYDYTKAVSFLTMLSKSIKRLYNQDETLIVESNISILQEG